MFESGYRVAFRHGS